MILGHNHHVIVPDTFDATARVNRVKSTDAELVKDNINIELFGDDLMYGRDPEQVPLSNDVGKADRFTAKISTPPEELIKVFLPQFQLSVNNRAVGNTASGNLLNGTDGFNNAWPDNIQANIIVVNHGLYDAKNNVSIQDYKNNLIALRQGLTDQQIMIWQTPAEALTVNTAPYASAMIEVAQQFDDLVADTRKIKNWTSELPDGEFPRQFGYSRLIEIVLSDRINHAILKYFNFDKHQFYRLDYQEKFLLENENKVKLAFTPMSASWVEIYHRKNESYYAVSRGSMDILTNPIDNISGHLAAGLHKVDTGEQIVSVTDGYTLTKIRREDGRVIYNKTFNFQENIDNAREMARFLNETSSDYIVIVTTYREPKANRLTFELLDAMYRCGASEELFSTSYFKRSAAYVLIGIPGCGKGKGIEAYAGQSNESEKAYCEILFEIASNGVPYAVDIFPPIAKVTRDESNVVYLKNPVYNLVANVPPINGERILNPRYPTYKTNAIPGEDFIVKGDEIYFTNPLTGVVTVVCDSQFEPSANGAVIHLDNIQNYDRFVQRFNPARWAPGQPRTTYPPAATGPLDPPQYNSASGVNSLGFYNTMIAARVGDSLYSEPVVLSQPNFGYVRLTADRTKMVYVPFPNFSGQDSFAYTLMTQHGQIGMPKCVYVEVKPETVDPVYELSVDKESVGEGDTFEITLVTDHVPQGTIIPYVLSGITSDDINGIPLNGQFVLATLQSGKCTASTTVTVTQDLKKDGTEFITLTLVDIFPTQSISVRINDTFSNPIYDLAPNITLAGEGDIVRFTLSADFVPDGTQQSYTISGVTSDDIAEPLSGIIVLNNSVGYQDVTIIRDVSTEGPETMIMTVSGANVFVTNSVVISDTSIDPTYRLSANTNIVNEGSLIKFFVNTTNVPNFSTIPYTITGINPADLTAPTVGSFTVQNNYAETVVGITADKTTEGPEIMVMYLQGLTNAGNILNTSVLINDTSQ